MIPKHLHQTCARPSWEERKLAQKARRLMPDWRYTMYDDDANAALLRSVFPEYEEQYRQLPRGVIRADIARCLYLYKFGGVYFDTDYKFFTPFPAALLHERCVLGVEEERSPALGRAKLGNAIMASEPGFPLWPAFVKRIFEKFAAGESDVVFLSGPHALTLFLENEACRAGEVSIVPSGTFYPALDRMKLSATKDGQAVGVHLCWGSWRNKPIAQKFRNRSRRIVSAVL